VVRRMGSTLLIRNGSMMVLTTGVLILQDLRRRIYSNPGRKLTMPLI